MILRIGFFDSVRNADVALEAGRAGEQHEQFVVLGDTNGFFGADVMRRCIQQARAFEHAGRVGKPDGVPVGFDFARSRPAGARAPIEILKGGRIEKQCF